MKWLKNYKLFESTLFNEEIEDILIELKDIGYTWKIDTKNWSSGKSILELIITNKNPRKYLTVEDFKEMFDTLIRIKVYMELQGFHLAYWSDTNLFELLEAKDWEKFENDRGHYTMTPNCYINFTNV